MKKVLLLIAFCFLLTSCQVQRNIKLTVINDYFDSLQDENENIVKIKAKSVHGHFFFRFYFRDDYSVENVEATLKSVKDFFDKNKVQEAIYTYYFDNYNEPAIVDQRPPSLWIVYYTKSSDNRVFYYEKVPVLESDIQDNLQMWHTDWVKYY